MLRNKNIEDNYIEVIIPDDLIKKAKLENTSLEFEITNEGLLIKPIQNDMFKDMK